MEEKEMVENKGKSSDIDSGFEILNMQISKDLKESMRLIGKEEGRRLTHQVCWALEDYIARYKKDEENIDVAVA